MTTSRQSSTTAPALRWGFAGTIALALLAATVSVLEVQRTRREVDTLARTADRSSYLVGELGREMTRLRAEALDHVLRGRPADDQRIADIEAALDARLRELAGLMQPDEQVHWQRFVPLLTRFRQQLTDVMLGLQHGRREQAAALLATEVGPLATRLQTELDALGEANQAESVALLEAADRRLVRMRHFQSGVDLLLVLGLAGIWWNVLRIIRRQRAQLDEHVARIEQSNRDLDAFAGRIAHDLRNALTPLAFLAARLRRQSPDSHPGEPVAHELEGAVRKARGLLDGLLAFSRAGRADDTDARASLSTVVDEVAHEVGPLAARLEVRLAIDVQDLEIACAPGLLHLVIANLVGNAVKFLEGRSRREVMVTASHDDGCCLVTIEDTGPGIPAHAVDRIFEPFYRVPGMQAAGTGIGLATVRRIVDAHGGQVTVESVPGEGTRFRIRLRLASPRARASSPAATGAPLH